MSIIIVESIFRSRPEAVRGSTVYPTRGQGWKNDIGIVISLFILKATDYTSDVALNFCIFYNLFDLSSTHLKLLFFSTLNLIWFFDFALVSFTRYMSRVRENIPNS